LLVASAAFCCLAFAFTLAVRKASAAVPLGTGVTLAVYFLSGNFFIIEHPPLVLRVVGDTFPVKHLNNALLTALNPNATGLRVEWVDLLVVAAWGLGGLSIALRAFRWTPTAAGRQVRVPGPDHDDPGEQQGE
jgi:ABC-2 type transport system permease protein